MNGPRHPGRRHLLAIGGRLAAALQFAGSTRAAVPLALQLAGLAAAANLTANAAADGASRRGAADASDYKALVCLFMAGGNDAHNWVVPMDAAGHAGYAAARGELALPRATLLPIGGRGIDAGRQLGLAPALQPLHALYQSGQAAIVANVGPLQRPTTLAHYQAGRELPSKLFSHNDQQSTWQSLQPEGAPIGWAGRMGDLLMDGNGQPAFTTVSTSGHALLLAGDRVTPYEMGPDGPVQVKALVAPGEGGSHIAAKALRRALLATGDNDYQNEYVRTTQRALDTAGALREALAATNMPALPAQHLVLPDSSPLRLPDGNALRLSTEPLARQLRLVAQMVQAGPALGLRRQVFMVSVGGFDTHANQARDHLLLSARVAHSAAWFAQALQAAGLFNRTLLFTASEFGRTLVSNGSGSDHGWGGHHFVLGGGVKGGALYGQFPVVALRTSTDAGSGRLLPTTSVTQYAAALGQWLGLGDVALNDVLPGLDRFAAGTLAFA